MKSYLTGWRGNFFIHEEENRIAGNSFYGPLLLFRMPDRYGNTVPPLVL